MERAAARIAGAWPAAVLLLADPAGWYPFGPLKWLAIGTGAALLGLCTFAARERAVASAPSRALVGLVAVMALAAATGLDRWQAWTGTPERHFGVVTWALVALAFAAGVAVVPMRSLVDGLLVAGAGVGLLATAEVLGWEPALFAVDDRASATLGSPAYLGAAAALLLPVAWTCAADRSLAAGRRALAATSGVSLVIAAVGSGARGAWLGLAVAAVAAIAARRRVHANALRARPRRALAGAVALAAVVVLAATAGGAAGRLADLGDPDSAGGASRVDEWRVATRVALAHPLLGTGPEGYRIAFAGEVDAAYQRAHGRAVVPDRAHSAPLDVLVSGGALALVAWCAALALVGRHVWRALRDDRAPVRGAGIALVAHVAGSLVLFPLAELEPIAWLLAGAVVAATASPGELRVVHRRTGHVVAAWACGLVAIASVAFGALDVVADRAARDAVDALAQGDTEQALARARDAAARRPDEVRLHLLVAEAARAAGRGSDEALDALDDARAISPGDPIVRRTRVALLVERSAATGRDDHLALARDAADDALDDDPLDPALLLQRARVAVLDGDDEAARALRRRAEELGG